MTSAFKDHNGKISSMRIVWMLSVIIILGVWGTVSLQNMELAHLTVGDATAFGLLFASKPASALADKFKGGSGDAK